MQTVSIIIPNKNGLPFLQQCIRSIKTYTDTPYEIIVVDNSSDDGSLDYCIKEGVRLISSPFNRGFPAACNLGMRVASGDAILLLNNDVIVTRNWLSNMLRCLYSSDDCGIVGPVSNYASGKQMISDTPYNSPDQVPNVENVPDSTKWIDVSRVVGFCYLFRREVMERVGLMDERFSPGHFEDDDYCYRARLNHYRLKIAGDAFVFHYGSASFAKEGEQQVKSLLKQNYDKFVQKWGVDPHSFI